MKDNSHSIFLIFLLLIGFSAVVALTARGWGYYTLSMEDRPFTEAYVPMKPSGPYSHGLGIIGSLLIITGVAGYSSRKRIRALAQAGRISRWLEVHIFLCLLGPILVIYHTTFKIGGVAAITFWTMISVMSSGIVGRFFYTRIPRNLQGRELTQEELDGELARLGSILRESPAGSALLDSIDAAMTAITPPASLLELGRMVGRLERNKWNLKRKFRRILAGRSIDTAQARMLRSAAIRRTSLLQQSLILRQVERFFYYWHAIHLPFTMIMFITLAMHVAVVILLGYRWIW